MPRQWDPPNELFRRVCADLLDREGVPNEEFQRGVLGILMALSLLPEHVIAARSEFDAVHTDEEDMLVGWTIQRNAVVQSIKEDGEHVASWRTVREDRRPQYAFVVAALLADGFSFEADPGHEPPPVWAYTSRPLTSPKPQPLSFWVCDSRCGNGTPAKDCTLTHVPPGHTALEVMVDIDEAVGLSWRRWDLALRGQYIPADALDGYNFGQRLGDENQDRPAREWPWLLRARSRASMLRCFTANNVLPGMAEDTRMEPGMFRNQFAIPSLDDEMVSDEVAGPNTDPDSWWDEAVAVDPEMAQWRRYSTLPVDQLRLPGGPDDSA